MKKRFHVGVHVAPMWMPFRLPFKLFYSNIKIGPDTRPKKLNAEF